MSSVNEFRDPYQGLNQPLTVTGKLEHLYRVLREHFEGIQRFALVVYEPESGLLSNFMYEGDPESSLAGYKIPLSDVPSLAALARSGSVRVVDDMRVFRSDDPPLHSQALLAQGYRSSLTMPLMHEGQLLAFLFLNASAMNYFDAAKAAYCNLWGHLVEQVMTSEQNAGQK